MKFSLTEIFSSLISKATCLHNITIKKKKNFFLKISLIISISSTSTFHSHSYLSFTKISFANQSFSIRNWSFNLINRPKLSKLFVRDSEEKNHRWGDQNITIDDVKIRLLSRYKDCPWVIDLSPYLVVRRNRIAEDSATAGYILSIQ